MARKSTHRSRSPLTTSKETKIRKNVKRKKKKRRLFFWKFETPRDGIPSHPLHPLSRLHCTNCEHAFTASDLTACDASDACDVRDACPLCEEQAVYLQPTTSQWEDLQEAIDGAMGHETEFRAHLRLIPWYQWNKPTMEVILNGLTVMGDETKMMACVERMWHHAPDEGEEPEYSWVPAVDRDEYV